MTDAVLALIPARLMTRCSTCDGIASREAGSAGWAHGPTGEQALDHHPVPRGWQSNSVRCQGCGESDPAHQTDGGHVVPEHAPGCCPDAGCEQNCPQPVLCGPVVPAPEYVAPTVSTSTAF